MKANLSSNSSILDIFQAFIPSEMIDLIADKTNCYAASKPSWHNHLKKQHDLEWKDVTSDEIKMVLGLCIFMGVVKKPVIKLYWSTKAMLVTPFYSEVLPRDRFLQILSNMHFENNAASKFGMLWKPSFQLSEKRLLLNKILLPTNHC